MRRRAESNCYLMRVIIVVIRLVALDGGTRESYAAAIALQAATNTAPGPSSRRCLNPRFPSSS
jgi:hypothetical protein